MQDATIIKAIEGKYIELLDDLLTALRNRARFALCGEAKKRCLAEPLLLPRRGSDPFARAENRKSSAAQR